MDVLVLVKCDNFFSFSLFILFEWSRIEWFIISSFLMDAFLMYSVCMREIDILWRGGPGCGGSSGARLRNVPMVCNRTV